VKEIADIVKEDWFHAKPWLVTGTGESLSRFTPEMIDKYNIWAIYVSLDVTKYADVFHYQDIYCNYYEGNWPDNYRYCAIRPHVAYHFIPERSVAIEYSGDVQGKEKMFNTVYPHSNSTSFAFLFLSSNGVKEIHTLGIDDGEGICEQVNQQYREESKNNPWKVENGTNNYWCEKHGSKWIKL
jgi:hypothetical protein